MSIQQYPRNITNNEPVGQVSSSLLPTNISISNGSTLRFAINGNVGVMNRPRLEFSVDLDYEIPAGNARFQLCTELPKRTGCYALFQQIMLRRAKDDLIEAATDMIPYILMKTLVSSTEDLSTFQNLTGLGIMKNDYLFRPENALTPGTCGKNRYCNIQAITPSKIRITKRFVMEFPFFFKDAWNTDITGPLELELNFQADMARMFSPRITEWSGTIDSLTDVGPVTLDTANHQVKDQYYVADYISRNKTVNTKSSQYGEWISFRLFTLPIQARYEDFVGSISGNTQLLATHATISNNSKATCLAYVNNELMTSGATLLIRVAAREIPMNEDSPDPSTAGRATLSNSWSSIDIPPSAIAGVEFAPRHGYASTKTDHTSLGETGHVIIKFKTTNIGDDVWSGPLVKIPVPNYNQTDSGMIASDVASDLVEPYAQNSDIRFEFILQVGRLGSQASTKDADKWVNVTPSNISLNNAKIVYEKLTVPPAIQQSYQRQLASPEGLQYTFPSIQATHTPIATTTNMILEQVCPCNTLAGVLFHLATPGYVDPNLGIELDHDIPFQSMQVATDATGGIGYETAIRYLAQDLMQSDGGTVPRTVVPVNGTNNATTYRNLKPYIMKGKGHYTRANVQLCDVMGNMYGISADGSDILGAINYTRLKPEFNFLAYALSTRRGYAENTMNKRLRFNWSLTPYAYPTAMLVTADDAIQAQEPLSRFVATNSIALNFVVYWVQKTAITFRSNNANPGIPGSTTDTTSTSMVIQT